MTLPTARLQVLLAASAPVGLVLRRGPSRWVCTLLWDRATDQFSLGQWFHGRIYEDKCDLSPDGRHLVYFAAKKGWHAFTAVSRAPYLTAVAFKPEVGTGSSGGYFTDTRSVWMGDCGTEVTRQLSRAGLNHVRRERPERWSGHGGTVYALRLQRGGWHDVGGQGSTYERELPGGWRLRKHCCTSEDAAGLTKRMRHHGPWEWHELLHLETGTAHQFADWTWADRDGDRLVWATAGGLWTGQVDGRGLSDSRCLGDFSDLAFEPVVAPYDGVPRTTTPWRP